MPGPGVSRWHRVLLALDLCVEQVRMALSLPAPGNIELIRLQHRWVRRRLGLERRHEAVIFWFDGGKTGICQMCNEDVAFEQGGSHPTNCPGPPNTTDRSGR